MERENFFRRTVSMLFAVSIMLFASVVGAEMKLYTATAEDYPSEVESQDTSKQRALDKAIKKATKQAGVYLKTYSRSVNAILTDDEVLAITSNAYEIVGEPKYTREIINHSGDTQIIVWKVTVEVHVDDSEIQSWIKRNDKDKSTIISQTREAQKASEENDRQIEDLREKYNRATSQSERYSIIKQMKQADRDFLANQKLEEGNKLSYSKNYEGAIKLYSEAIQLKPDWSWPYNNRGLVYYNLRKYERAIRDYDMAIEIDINNFVAYNNRGAANLRLGKYKISIRDFNKAIQVNSIYGMAYNNRGVAYFNLSQFTRSLQDFNKAIQLNYVEAYVSRGIIYKTLKQYERAIQDYNKAIQLNPNDEVAYYNRGVAYAIIRNYKQAFADVTKAIQINPNYALAYQLRGLCYQQLGDNEKAQADFDKAKELGYKG